MHITISPEVAALYRKAIAKEDGAGIRISLKRSGCSGWKYETKVQPKFAATDERLTLSSGIVFFIPREDVLEVDGLVISLEGDRLGKKIVFRHPSIVGACGCGESVTLKDKK